MAQESHRQQGSQSRVSPQVDSQQDISARHRPEAEENVLVPSLPSRSPKGQSLTRKERLIAKLTQFHSPGMVTEESERNDFIKKVYTTLTLQLIVIVGFELLVTLLDPLRDWVEDSGAVAGLCFASGLIILIGTFYWRELVVRTPYNYLALLAFTILEAYVVAFVSVFYGSLVLRIATLMALALTAVLSFYVWLTRRDFSICGGGMIVISMSLFLFALFLVPFFNTAFFVLFSFAAVVVYGSFVVYDIQLIAGGRYSGLSYDDYILGVLFLHIDIVGLFVHFLKILCTVSDE